MSLKHIQVNESVRNSTDNIVGTNHCDNGKNLNNSKLINGNNKVINDKIPKCSTNGNDTYENNNQNDNIEKVEGFQIKITFSNPKIANPTAPSISVNREKFNLNETNYYE